MIFFTRYRMPLLGAFSCRPSVSPEPSAARMPLLMLWLSPTGYCCRERQNPLFVFEYTSSRVWFLYSNYYKRNTNISREIEDFVITHLCKLRGILRSCLKQNKDVVWSRVLRLVTGVRADPKYSYSHLCMISYICT